MTCRRRLRCCAGRSWKYRCSSRTSATDTRDRATQLLGGVEDARTETAECLVLEGHHAVIAYRGETRKTLPIGDPRRTLAWRRCGENHVGIACDDGLGIDKRARLGQVRKHVTRATQLERIAHQVSAAHGVDRAIPHL